MASVLRSDSFPSPSAVQNHVCDFFGSGASTTSVFESPKSSSPLAVDIPNPVGVAQDSTGNIYVTVRAREVNDEHVPVLG